MPQTSCQNRKGVTYRLIKRIGLRPPGAAVLPVAGLLIGLSLGQSIQLGLLSCSVIGGYGWLLLFKKFCINKHITFIVAIFLGLKTGASIYSYDSANIILYALVPWFLLLTFIISGRLREWKHSFREYLIIGIFLFMLGCFAWIKLSGLIVSGTIGACLFYAFISVCHIRKGEIPFGIWHFGHFFWSPFLVLEKVNYSLTGITADQLYEGNDSDIPSSAFLVNFGGIAQEVLGYYGVWFRHQAIPCLQEILPMDLETSVCNSNNSPNGSISTLLMSMFCYVGS